LKVFENGVLRRKFGPNRDEVTGVWKTPHNDITPNIARVIKL